MKQTGGNIEFARYGVRIGGIPLNVTRQTDGADLCCTSTVTVAGGTFNCSAENNHGDTPNQSMYGFVVGAGLVGKTYAHLMNGWKGGRFVVSNDAVITIGKCTNTGRNYVKIVDCAARIGDFAAENIILTQTGGDLSVRQASNGSIYLVRKLPLCIIFK